MLGNYKELSKFSFLLIPKLAAPKAYAWAVTLSPAYAPLGRGHGSHVDTGSENPFFCLGPEHFWFPSCCKNTAVLCLCPSPPWYCKDSVWLYLRVHSVPVWAQTHLCGDGENEHLCRTLLFTEDHFCVYAFISSSQGLQVIRCHSPCSQLANISVCKCFLSIFFTTDCSRQRGE